MRVLVGLVFFFSIVVGQSAFAQSSSSGATAAMQAASQAAITGPAKFRLNNRGTIDLPEDFVFVPHPEADQLLEALTGDSPSDVLGLVFSRDVTQPWFIAIQWAYPMAFGRIGGSSVRPASNRQGTGYEALNQSPFATGQNKARELQWTVRLESSQAEAGSDSFIGDHGEFAVVLLGNSRDAYSLESLRQLERVVQSIHDDRTWATAFFDMAGRANSLYKNNRILLLLVFAALGFALFRGRAARE